MIFIALLRGINVGGNSKIEMKKLKITFENLGFNRVLTYINSGNVIFETEEKSEIEIVNKIEKVIEKDFGLKVSVVIRSSENLKKINEIIPANWLNDKQQKTDILFLWDEVDKIESVTELNGALNIDNLIYTPGAIIWNILRENYNKSSMNKFIGSRIYKKMTARNVNTVRKLVEIMKIKY